MKTIGIIGASGQVGMEVCLFLKTYPDVCPVAIVRSKVSAALLSRLGIDCRIGSLREPEECRSLLKDCDLVVDFSVVTGDVNRINEFYQNNITKVVECAPPGAGYVFISTINAFGMGGKFNKAKWYPVPHTIYAKTKRYGENLAFQHGRRHRKEVFVFRLGHVHGLLQQVSAETRALVNEGRYTIFEYPDTPAYTVFCFTIAEALANVAHGREKPGIYTLVSEPAWSWREVLEYFVEEGNRIEVRLIAPPKSSLPQRWKGYLKGRLMAFLSDYKDTLRANVLRYFPEMENSQKARLYASRAASQVDEWLQRPVYKASGIHEGVFGGRRLKAGTDSRVSMQEKKEVVEKMLAGLQGD